MTPEGKPRPPKDAQSEAQQASPTDRDLRQFVASLPDDKKIELYKFLEISVETTFSGPLPSPEDLKKYNEVLPDAADRIMNMAEKEQQIRADGQAGILANDRLRINRATLFGVSLIVVAGIATWLGRTEIALPLGLVGTVVAILRQVMDWLDQRQSRRPPSPPDETGWPLPTTALTFLEAAPRGFRWCWTG